MACLGDPGLALAVVVAIQTGLQLGWVDPVLFCSGLPWAFCLGKGLQPVLAGAGEAEMLLELHCCPQEHPPAVS